MTAERNYSRRGELVASTAVQESLSSDEQLQEAIASLRHIATTACRCSWNEDDLLENCSCDAAQTAVETLKAMGVSVSP
jgi:hypothetical protein